MLGLVGKINEGYFRKTDFLLLSHGLFYQIFGFCINYFVQIGLGLGLKSFGHKFSNISC